MISIATAQNDAVARVSDAGFPAYGIPLLVISATIGNMSAAHEEATSLVDQKYYERIDAMSPKERVAISMQMLDWARQTIARQITSESGPMSPERLRWLVALRQYGAEPEVRKLIERMLERVPD